jgi:hypothetical protein
MLGENTMSNLRRWQLDSTSPFSLQLAADARLSQTDYQDDQIWEVRLERGEAPALALQTRYGGRAGLASIVPMWLHEGRVVYQTQAYAHPPTVTTFAPGYVRLQGSLSPQLAVQAEFWVMESHAVGARLTLANAHTVPTDVQLDLLGFIALDGKEQKTSIIPTANGGAALSLGKAGNLFPVLVLEGATPAPNTSPSSHKISRKVTVEGRKKTTLRWVHAGLPDARQSLALAQKWLEQDWEAAFQKIAEAAQAILEVETGNADWDTTIAFAYQQLAQSFLKPTASLPHPSFVSTRQPGRGFQNDHDRAWSGQNPTQAYLTGLGIASIHPSFAQGIIRNYLAVQQPDGWIDWRPGLGGQKQGDLCLPILARLAWGIFQYTEDANFLRDIFPGLQKFFERWLQADLDADGDGIPEWQSEKQTGYPFMPTFASWQGWGQGTDIRLVETPDMAAYLLSEAKSLLEIAYFLRDENAQHKLDAQIAKLQAALDSLWNPGEKRYTYRDRDTHTSNTGMQIVSDARGGDELILSEKISPPNRLIVNVSGGMNLTPRIKMRLSGFDQHGAEVKEEVQTEQFFWSHGRGIYTSRTVFSQIDTITFEGLSRVYRIDAVTADTSRLDINALLPMWSAGIPGERATDLTQLMMNPDYFWRGNGVVMCSAQDPNYDPSNAEGSGGVWPFWLTLIGEGLIEYGMTPTATELVKRLLNTQASLLRSQKVFSEFYHSDEVKGLGEPGHTGGLVPLHLLMRILGIRIINSAKVWVGGVFAWEQPITIRQHGVTVRRTMDGTEITFPSGYQTQVKGETWQEVVDPHAKPAPTSPPPLEFDDLEAEID